MQVDNIYKSDDGGITWNAIVPENNNSLLNALGRLWMVLLEDQS